MFVGSFEPDDFDQFQKDVADAIDSFKASGVTRLLIDLTNNGGMKHYITRDVTEFSSYRWFRLPGPVFVPISRRG